MLTRSFTQFLRVFFVTLALVACSSLPKAPKAPQNRTDHLSKPYVILVSFDGFRYDYAKRYQAKNLLEMTKTGTSAEGLIPVYPSKTFPNHYSIATGLYAEDHGLISNGFYDPVRKQHYALGDPKTVQDGSWYGGDPLWVVAAREGMIVSSFFWVGSEAEIKGYRPHYYKLYDKSVSREERVKASLDWLAMPAIERPHLLMLYFSDVDSAAHEFGTESEQTKKAVADLDQVLGELRAGIKASGLPVNLIVVSDHGMQDLDKSKIEYPDDYVDLSGFQVQERGPQILLYLNEGQGPEVLERTYQTLRKKAKHFRVFKRADVPKELRYSKSSRIGDLVLMARTPWSLMLRTDTRPIPAANHGYEPLKDKNMWGIFYAEGPDFAAGTKLKAFSNTEVYPKILKILALPDPRQ